MGITCKPFGKFRSIMDKIDSESNQSNKKPSKKVDKNKSDSSKKNKK